MTYNIEIRKIEPIRIAYIKYKGVISETNKIFPEVFKSINGRVNGSPFFCYYKIDEKTKIADMELCVPTEETPNNKGISVKTTPEIKALCTTHVGSYETLNNAYKEIEKYSIENNLILQPPFREVYIKGPGMFFKGNPKNYITEILFPLKEVK
jgi:effector-binding domain-containing protein